MENEFKIDVYEIMGTSTPAGRTSEDGEPAGDTIKNLLMENWEKYEIFNPMFLFTSLIVYQYTFVFF